MNVQPSARNRSDHRPPRSDLAASHAPDARAPALRAGARPRRRSHSRRVRRRPAQAAPDARRVPRRPGRAVSTRPGEGPGADRRLPSRAANGRAARAERGPRRSARGRRAGGRAPGDALVCGADAARAGRHQARHPQLHLPRHPQGARPAGRPARRGRHPVAARRRRRGGAGGARPAGRLRRQPVGARRGRPARPADRAAEGAAAHARSALPAPEERPGLRGRCRRRQDRHGRGARAAPPAGRRARGACRRRGLRARHGGAAGRHALPRRLRRAVQGRPCCPAEAEEPHPLHRRAAQHRRSRSDDGRHDGFGDAAQARAH